MFNKLNKLSGFANKISAFGIIFLVVLLITCQTKVIASSQTSQPNLGYIAPSNETEEQKTNAHGSRGCLQTNNSSENLENSENQVTDDVVKLQLAKNSGPDSEISSLILLTPSDHVAVTTSEHPTFLMYLPKMINQSIIFTIVEPNVTSSIVEKKLTITHPGFVQIETIIGTTLRSWC